MKKLFIAGLLLVTSLSAFAEDEKFDLATGHWGVEVDMMPGGATLGSMQVSAAYETDQWLATLGWNQYHQNAVSSGSSQSPAYTQAQQEFKIAKRYSVAPYSYLDLGWDYSWSSGTDNTGGSVNKDYTTGPMVMFSRQFPNSHVMFEAFVIPYQYSSTNDSSTGFVEQTGYQILMNGGVGIVYLF